MMKCGNNVAKQEEAPQVGRLSMYLHAAVSMCVDSRLEISCWHTECIVGELEASGHLRVQVSIVDVERIQLSDFMASHLKYVSK